MDYLEGRSRSRVLLATSEPELCSTLATGLFYAGHAVFAVQNGHEAFAALAAIAADQLPMPDVIVMDAWLPIQSGIELLALLRFGGWAIPVILLSGHVDRRMRVIAERLQAFACLQKPPSLESLTHTIDDAVRRQSEPDSVA